MTPNHFEEKVNLEKQIRRIDYLIIAALVVMTSMMFLLISISL